MSAHKSRWPVVTLASVLTPRREAVVLSEDGFAVWTPITIHFDGSIEPRDMRGKEDFKGAMFAVYPGDLVFSKIDARNGALGLLPAAISQAVVTAEYPVYHVDESQIVPEYLELCLQTVAFKQSVNSLVSGTSGRKRVQPEAFVSLTIPLPPLETQRAIVARWQQAQAEIAAANERVEQLEKETLASIKTSLGREPATQAKRSMIFALNFKDLDRWGADVCWKSVHQTFTAKYPIVQVSDLCQISSGGTPSRKIPEYFGGDIPWVKTTEVRDSVIYEADETLTQSGLENSSAKIYPEGSLLVAMYGQGATRGRTAKLGIDAATNQACAVLTRFDEQIEVDFLWYYLMSEYDDLRALASGNNQPNLNAEMIAKYPVPLPPLDIQRAIVCQVEAGRAEVARLREQASQRALAARAEVEAALLGEAQIVKDNL